MVRTLQYTVWTVFLSCLFLPLPAWGQPIFEATNIDSLKEVLSKSTDPLESIHLRTYLAEIFRFSGDQDSIGIYIDKSFEILDAIQDQDTKEEAYVIIIEAVLPMNVDSLAEIALAYIKNPQRKARIFLELQEYQTSVRSYREMDCQAIMDSVLLYLNQDPNEELLVEYYHKKGYCFLQEDKLLEALKLTVEAEKITKTEYPYSSNVYNRLAYIYTELRAHGKALEMAAKAQRISAEQGSLFNEGDAIHFLNDAAFAQGRFDLIKESRLRFEQIDAQIKGNSLSRVYIMLGKVAIEEDRFEEAELYFTKGLNLDYKLDIDVSGCYAGLSRVSALQGDWDKAKYYADLSLENFSSAFSHDLSARNRVLASVYAEVGDHKTAFQLLQREIEQRIKTDSVVAPYQIIETLLNDNFEQERSSLEQELDFQKQLGNRNLLIGLVGSGLVFLTFLFFYNRKKNASRTQELNRLVKEQTEEILIQQEKLQELDRFKSRLYTNITHEFRTPLTVILGTAEQMSSKYKTTALGKAKKQIDMISRNGQNLLNLVNQLLDLSKIESNQLKVHYTQGNMVHYVHYITESFHSLANMQNVLLRVKSEQAEILMDYDQEKYRQILSNLISNAIKFTPSGGKVLVNLRTNGPSVEEKANIVSSERVGKVMEIEVIDSGPGIEAENLPLVFDRFYQADDAASKAGGTGIGLALTKELVKLLEGTIEVESVPGKGATFRVRLPIRNEAPFKASPAPSSEQGTSLTAIESTAIDHAKRATELAQLLIIEDNPDVIEYLNACLQDQYQLEFAYNGQAGIDKAIEHIPDIIISDVMMPGKDGFEVCQFLKNDERTSHIPIILLTAKADIESRLTGLSQGADAYLAKPFYQQELIINLQNLLELRQKLQKKYLGQTLVQSSELQVDSSIPPGLSEKETAFLQKLHDFIDEYIDDPDFGVPHLARKMNLSQSQLYRKIKALTDKSTASYIRSFRLYRSQAFLLEKNLSISEIAYAVGFSSLQYFSDAFLEEFGLRPSEFDSSNT